MSEFKNLIDLTLLTKYHTGLKTLIDSADAEILAQAKLYCDNLSDNYDPAGKAQTLYDLLKTEVDKNTEAITKLNGDSSVEGSVDKKVADAINTFATQISDDGTINTYKEVLNYLSTHQGEATEMASAIDTLETLVGSKSVATQIAEAITAENLAQYATDEELAAAIARIVVIEGDYLKSSDKTELNTAIADAKKAGTDAQTDVDNLETYVGTIPEGYTEETVIAYINKKAEETLSSATGGSSESAASVKAQLDTYKASNDAVVATNTADIDKLEESLAEGGTTANAIADAKKAGTDAQTDVDALEEKVGEVADGKTVVQMIEDAQTAATYDDTEVRSLITANDTAIDELAETHNTDKAALEASIQANTDAIAAFSLATAEDIDAIFETEE